MTWGYALDDAIAKEPEVTYDYELWIEDIDNNDVELIDGPIEQGDYMIWHHDLGIIAAKKIKE